MLRRLLDSLYFGNAESAEETESDSSLEESCSQLIVERVGSSPGSSVRAEEMSEAPVSFVVGEPDPDPDPSEVQEIEDSFPSEGNDIANVQVQNNVTPGLLERRKRLRNVMKKNPNKITSYVKRYAHTRCVVSS